VIHVLGIDAGGTKTVCQLADERGTVIAESRGVGANLQAVGELEVEKVLHQVMEKALEDVDIVPDGICLGIAGVDRPDDAAVVRGIMKRIGYKARVLVVNDALVALESGAPGQPGIVIISGTGSISYGRNAAGMAARSGGWGYVLGDEGSGYWIGRAFCAPPTSAARKLRSRLFCWTTLASTARRASSTRSTTRISNQPRLERSHSASTVPSRRAMRSRSASCAGLRTSSSQPQSP
jgi:N-acetylglucosamine kinase-like BadF-type ATPase